MLLQKINDLLEIKGRGTQKKLADFIGETPVNVNRYIKGSRDIPVEIIPKIAEFFNVSTDYLLGNDIIKSQVKTIPIIGTTSCGGTELSNHVEIGAVCYYNGAYYKDSLYCVVANGDSMAPEIEDGDEIICDPDVVPENGDMVHYTIENESAVKVFVKDEDAYIIQFIPYNANENFKTRTFRLDDEYTANLKIAKVVAVNKLKYNNRAARLRMIGR
ncbi:LexA family protein [Sulfurimonas sp.]|uniref:LexA family protein n=1 Tax=Sulfurimonas sp. TaxID=2022749 RepID=UPI003568E4FF